MHHKVLPHLQIISIPARNASQSLATRLLTEVEDSKKGAVPARASDASAGSAVGAEPELLRAAVREAKREIKQLQAQNAALSQQLEQHVKSSKAGPPGRMGDHRCGGIRDNCSMRADFWS